MPSTPSSASTLLTDLLGQVVPPFTGEALFDLLPNIVFFMKNAAGAYVLVNTTLVARCGLKHKSELLGRRPSQVFRAPLGDSYEAQDRDVLTTGRPLLGQLERHLYPARDVGWCLTSKLPLLRADGTVAGLVGLSQDLQTPDAESEDYRQIAIAVDHARSHLADRPGVLDLARLAGMSRYQLDRRMLQVFGLTTGQWLLKQRIDTACQKLVTTDDPIAAIAIDSGYSDQSAFTRQFRAATGLSPRDYRQTRRPSR